MISSILQPLITLLRGWLWRMRRSNPLLACARIQAKRISPSPGICIGGISIMTALAWHADPHPLTSTIRAIIAEDSRQAENIAQLWLEVSLCERDFDGARRALAALPIAGCYDDTVPFPRAWCEGVVAQMRGDKAAAHAAFTSAR